MGMLSARITVVVVVVLLALVYGVPLLGMGWDTYDDGLILRRHAEFEQAGGLLARHAAHWTIEHDWGRTRPIYWLIQDVQVSLFGGNPLAYRASRWLFLALSVGTLTWVAASLTRSTVAGLVAGLLLLVFGPFPQLGQSALFSWGRIAVAEPLSVPLLAMLLWACWHPPPARKTPRRWRYATIALMSVLLVGVKETNLTLPLACALLPWLRVAFPSLSPGSSQPASSNWWPVSIWCAAPAVAVFTLGWLVSGAVGEAGYAGEWRVQGVGAIAAIYLRYLGMLTESYGPLPYIAPLLLLIRCVLAVRRRAMDDHLRLACGLLIIGLAGVLPLGAWGQVYSRYLMPSMTAWAVFFAQAWVWLLVAAWDWSASRYDAPVRRRAMGLAAGALGILALLWAWPLLGLALGISCLVAWFLPRARFAAAASLLGLLLAWTLLTGVTAVYGYEQCRAIRFTAHSQSYNALLRAVVDEEAPAIYFDLNEPYEIIRNTDDLLRLAFGRPIPVGYIDAQSDHVPALGSWIIQNINMSAQMGRLEHLPGLVGTGWRARDITRDGTCPALANWPSLAAAVWQRGPGVTMPPDWQRRVTLSNRYLIFRRES